MSTSQTSQPKKRPRWLPWAAGGAIVTVLAAVVGGGFWLAGQLNQPPEPTPQAGIPASSQSSDYAAEVALISGQSTGGAGDGLGISLSEGQPEPEQIIALPVTRGEALSPEEIDAILARLPELTGEAGDQVDFRLPVESLPPPRTGETITETFGEAGELSPPPVPEGPLEVLRYAPEGEIPVAPFINITFNQPMVPLATVEDLAALGVPVQIEPELAGTWRWLGTKTLNFQVDSELIDRLPMATEYLVTIPAGTTSLTGGELAETIAFSFSTPPPVVVNTYPYDEPQPLEPLFFIAFNQRIEPAAMLDYIQVTAGRQEVELALATPEEIEADKEVARLVENAPEGRWLAFKASEPLPADTAIAVIVQSGAPSAEGPLVTTEDQSYSFRTYAALRIQDHGCSWGGSKCPPLTPFYIQFNNPIDLDAYQPEMITVEPLIPGAQVDIYGNTINIRGMTQGQTNYEVTVHAEIQDIFGQTLGEDEDLTFRVGPAEPILIGPDQNLVTLDPAADEPVLSLYVINYSRLDLQIYAVEPDQWPDFQYYLREYQRKDNPPDPPGVLLLDETRRLEIPEDSLTEVTIELGQYLDGDFGHLLVLARPPSGLFSQDRYWETVHVWVQVTQIGLDAFVDHDEMVVWTTALQDGSNLPEVPVRADNERVAVTTGANGTVRFDLPASGIAYLVASQGEDQVLLPRSPYTWSDEKWQPWNPDDQLRWYVFDDRQMYRPGESVHVKGWMRDIGGAEDGDVTIPNIQELQYEIIDPQGNRLGDGSVAVNVFGGFDLAFDLPENTNLGYAQLIFTAPAYGWQGQYNHSFQIQEFRRPEFEVTARNETTGPYFAGEHAVLAVEAAYYAGGPLPNAEVTWMVSSSPTNYAPPNWPDFTFGHWQPWWWWYEGPAFYEGPQGYGYSSNGSFETFDGTTDATGTHYLRLDFDPANPEAEIRPFSVLAEGTVMDVNRQAWTGTTSLLVHPGAYYVGLRSERYFVERGTPLEIELIVADIDGNPIADRQVEVTAARLDWQYQNGSWQEVEVDPQECLVGSKYEPVSCTFDTAIGGRYKITARVTDSQGRPNESSFTRWVSGGQLPPTREVEQESVTLIPDKESYQPGETARILVQAPFSPAEGLLTVSRGGMLYTERFTVEDGSATIEVPIESEHIPNLQLQVDLTGSAPRTDDAGNPLAGVPDRPAYATGRLNLSIPPLERTLDLEVTPRDTALEPGGETTIAVKLTDANGDPVAGGELAVVVVDEAILALTNYSLSDPLAVFYQERYAELYSTYLRASIVLADPQTLAAAAGEAQNVVQTVTVEKEVMLADTAVMEEAAMEAPAAAPMEAEAGFGRGDDSAATPITVRMDFNPLATFAASVLTDPNGEARIEVKLPDNLTRYRVMVVAVDAGGARFGSGEANLTARLPLMVRPAAPRFLNFGDQFQLPVVLQNQTDEAMEVEVVVQTSNLALTEVGGLRVSVPANDRIEVRFPATTEMAGTARLQIAAVSGNYADAAQIELPVYTPATTEAFATYGVVDEGAIVQPIASPSDVYSQFGGLQIQTSSTALQALTDAVLYLVSYPYDCTEQLASRILGVAALRDVLTAFEAEGLPSPQEMEAAVGRDIEMLRGLQNYDGGFPYWRRGYDSIPFHSIHVAHALQRAQEKGFEVPQEMLTNVRYYLQEIEDHYPSWYSQNTRWTLSAYALYVRDRMGDPDPQKARNLIAEAGLEKLSLDAVGFLWSVLLDDPASSNQLEQIRTLVNNRVVETAGAANFTIGYDEQTYLLLSSNRRTDAILLEALIGDNPDSDLIPKLVTGLLAHRERGRWNNTQENVFVLLALDRYFNVFESQTPDFVARIWLGETYAGEHAYAGRTTERHETEVPMVYLVDPELGGGQTQNLIISKEGPGRLYYRLGLTYAPTDLWLEPLDMGFVVLREYEAVDNPEDVYQDEDGVWHIKAGARVRVRLTMVADNRRYHVALVDPLPAGLEIINPALAVSGSVPQDPNSADSSYGWWWWWTWYEHQNLRDTRAEAFTSLLWDGVYEYTYIARATTPGTFVAPPAHAEEMYSPEVFGRSGSDWVIVED